VTPDWVHYEVGVQIERLALYSWSRRRQKIMVQHPLTNSDWIAVFQGMTTLSMFNHLNLG
jgi:hypothetical protein